MPQVIEQDKARLLKGGQGVILLTSAAAVAYTAAETFVSISAVGVHLVMPPSQTVAEYPPPIVIVPLDGERYPALVSVWDNDDDAIYDKI
jgi:hypothetical protein